MGRVPLCGSRREWWLEMGRATAGQGPIPLQSHLWSGGQPEISPCLPLSPDAGLPCIVTIPGAMRHNSCPQCTAIPRSPCPLQLLRSQIAVSPQRKRLLPCNAAECPGWIRKGWRSPRMLGGCSGLLPSSSNTEAALLSHPYKPGLVLGNVGETELTKEESRRHKETG